ncbi:MAG: protein FxsA [Pseudonocardiales bacterium]|nr:protein FxsA [Pseudonocardiales bacterium]
MPLVLLTLVMVLIVVPLTEISLIVAVGHQIGVLPTVLLLLSTAIAGSWLLRRQGRRAWREVRAAAEAGRPPALEAVSGVLVLAGALLMMLPGFATDVLGLLLMIPPLRRSVARLVLTRFVRGLPPEVATGLLGPSRVRATRRAANTPAPEPGPVVPQAPIQPGAGRVIEGEIDS